MQDFWWEIKGERHDRLVMRLLVAPQERQARVARYFHQFVV
ncbi:MAG: hypothetical protein SVR94_09530 [Pseudomonadota bacterium]|nr:hypothetical protein [Pseudomonadota bacterium]